MIRKFDYRLGRSHRYYARYQKDNIQVFHDSSTTSIEVYKAEISVGLASLVMLSVHSVLTFHNYNRGISYLGFPEKVDSATSRREDVGRRILIPL